MGLIINPYRFAGPGLNRIPTMTAATTSGVTMSADTEFGAPQLAWKAGDKITASGTGWLSTGGGQPHILKVNFGAGTYIDNYAITGSGDGNYVSSPTAWTLDGSNDDSAWTTLDTRSGITGWTKSLRRAYAVATPGTWQYYRIRSTAAQDGGGYTCIGELELIF